MTNMFTQLKKAAQMRMKMNKIQKEMARITVEARSGDVTAVVSCDMMLRSVKWAPDAFDPARPERFEKMLVAAVNSALEDAKKRAAEEMSKMSGGLGGLAEMLGGQ